MPEGGRLVRTARLHNLSESHKHHIANNIGMFYLHFHPQSSLLTSAGQLYEGRRRLASRLATWGLRWGKPESSQPCLVGASISENALALSEGTPLL